MKKLFGVFWCLIVIFFNGCLSSGSNTAAPQKVEDLPFITLSAPNGNVFSYFETEAVDSPLAPSDASIFNENIVYRFETPYRFDNKDNKIIYYAIVFDFNRTELNNNNVKYGEIIGRARGGDPKYLVFCETIDPYLIINSRSIPVQYGGFYWFEGSFLFSNGGTNWFSFEKEENIENRLKEMAELYQDSPGLTLYSQFRVFFKLNLQEYPKIPNFDESLNISASERALFNRSNLTSFINVINIGNSKFYLCWQRGFDEYLRREYTLNDDIWLYVMCATFNSMTNTGCIFIRDFALETMEERYENRMKQIGGSE